MKKISVELWAIWDKAVAEEGEEASEVQAWCAWPVVICRRWTWVYCSVYPRFVTTFEPHHDPCESFRYIKEKHAHRQRVDYAVAFTLTDEEHDTAKRQARACGQKPWISRIRVNPAEVLPDYYKPEYRKANRYLSDLDSRTRQQVLEWAWCEGGFREEWEDRYGCSGPLVIYALPKGRSACRLARAWTEADRDSEGGLDPWTRGDRRQRMDAAAAAILLGRFLRVRAWPWSAANINVYER